MKHHLIIFFLFSLFLSGCARYDATTLCAFSSDLTQDTLGISVAAKAFSKEDCKQYLDRNVICKGYQPIQIYIENTTDSSYLFSTSRISLPIAPPDEVAQKVHSSMVGRIAGYGAAAVLASPFIAVPGIIDGFISVKANKTLDQDFQSKAARDCVILPYSHANMILFVPKKSFKDTFSVTLVDEKTNKPVKIIASTR